tara:strand:+ start:96 stop:497 length:402 start_codon:yes stop_codon:yes gene_type:complete
MTDYDLTMSSLFFIQIFILLLIFLPLILGLIFMGTQKKIVLKHKDSGINKNGFVGYCWTYFFFGFFVPIFRGEIMIGIFHLIFSLVTFGIFQLVMPFLYNKQYSTRLLTTGWELNDSEEKNMLARLKIGIAKP